jgi:MoxR-like ATPase
LFHQLLLADEINRAPAKVQSALLEAMEERQVTIGQTSYPLSSLFMVMATQNPLEHEGVYPLPEAQLDRFLFHVRVDYPDATVEHGILHLARAEARAALDRQAAVPPAPTLMQEDIFAARLTVLELFLHPDLADYIVRLVAATRAPESAELAGKLLYGASPRATIALDRAARARAWLAGRDYVSPEDIQDLAPDVLRHRLRMSWEAQAAGETVDGFVAALIARVAVP